MQTHNVPVGDLKAAEYNPRHWSDKATSDLKESIRRFGIVDPIIANGADGRRNIVIGGHFRLHCAKEIGYTEVPVVYVDISDIEKEKELNLRLNRNTGDWDYSLLANFDESLLMDSGFSSDELSQIFPVVHERQDDEVPDLPEEPQSKLGDLYELGSHRVLCGDSTKVDDVERLMNGKKADMVFTDPPYGMFLNADWSGAKSKLSFQKEKGLLGGKKYDNVIGDGDDFKDEFITTTLAVFDYCKEVFMWGGDYYAHLIPERNKGSWIVWDKRLDESADKMYGSCYELCWSKNRHKREIARVKWAGVFGTEQEPEKKRSHPTQKPCLLSEWFFSRYAKEKGLIADLFLGSGSTLIAAEKTGRICYGMELDPKYVDVIVSRYCDFVGTNTVRKNGEMIEWKK